MKLTLALSKEGNHLGKFDQALGKREASKTRESLIEEGGDTCHLLENLPKNPCFLSLTCDWTLQAKPMGNKHVK